MTTYAFQFVKRVVFHVGTGNVRSQKALEKFGARSLGLREISHPDGRVRVSLIYELSRAPNQL